ncbi:TIGR03619 family F420-dependent LLM class oxidoreductase [Cryptosporangium aurantiacum]|uniref:Probable F420-dependent oxidoreductase, Rv2161c family n=1 Tax=Cryptosporangium aurantiacum TaxID=134849 RepID=A0A1M7RK05_9ACTN|nr:TIGR03619 family F420-dependent LLM class oxidoreductase [Cryptosporangium aurantiacum]SHN46470.1 probable F420-dependent oxidoreductase, Rv2161c family [Cryptosporangium aurantiacum]
MKWTLAAALVPAGQLLDLARAAEENGYNSLALPDSVFYPEQVSAKYPYTKDGSRFWPAETEFIDPFVAIPAMAAVTTQLEFHTNVYKLPLRDPLLTAKQVASIAVMSDNRFAFGVGLSWIPEEFRFTHTEMRTRGARTDEAIEIIKAVCAGKGPEWVEYHGRHYDFDRLMISPAPTRPVRIFVGGHSEPALARTARIGDGWISVNTSPNKIIAACERLAALRAEYGRDDEPFEIIAGPVGDVSRDDYRRLEEAGVTECQAAPWWQYGVPLDDRAGMIDAARRFADEVIATY